MGFKRFFTPLRARLYQKGAELHRFNKYLVHFVHPPINPTKIETGSCTERGGGVYFGVNPKEAFIAPRAKYHLQTLCNFNDNQQFDITIRYSIEQPRGVPYDELNLNLAFWENNRIL